MRNLSWQVKRETDSWPVGGHAVVHNVEHDGPRSPSLSVGARVAQAADVRPLAASAAGPVPSMACATLVSPASLGERGDAGSGTGVKRVQPTPQPDPLPSAGAQRPNWIAPWRSRPP